MLVAGDSFFEAKRAIRSTEMLNLVPPKPESAPNKFLAKLFESP